MIAVDFGCAWLAMAIAFGLHVVDEAAHDFLAWYNPVARSVRARLKGVPFPPTFSFWPWFLGLLAITATLVWLAPFAHEGRPWLRPVALALGTINTSNGLMHLVGSAIVRRRAPGVLSAPALLVSSLWLLYATIRAVTS